MLNNFNLSQEILDKINNIQFNSLKGIRNNLTGKTFGKLYVLGRGEDYISPRGKRASQWWCLCNCAQHNILLIRGSNLTSGNSKSCGCLNIEKSTERIIEAGKKSALDLTNKNFGELIAIQPTEKRKNGSVVWECLCSCGNLCEVTAIELQRHGSESCGCLKESKGVRKIKKLLDDNNIPYETEKTFPDCKFEDTGAYARYDFYIDNKFLLEYDGIQHFKECDSKFFRDSLKKRQAHDNYKDEYAQSHNIPLKRIPYYDYDKITLEKILED